MFRFCVQIIIIMRDLTIVIALSPPSESDISLSLLALNISIPELDGYNGVSSQILSTDMFGSSSVSTFKLLSSQEISLSTVKKSSPPLETDINSSSVTSV